MAMESTRKERQEQWLRSATAWQRRPFLSSEPVGAIAARYLEQHLGVFEKSESTAAAFGEAVGWPLLEYCRPDKFEKGVLYVHCSPGPYLHLLKTREVELTEKTRAMCPKARLRAIRFSVHH
jgi:hypothetical protein